jgi:exodeoxyribonuclease VII small subunit
VTTKAEDVTDKQTIDETVAVMSFEQSLKELEQIVQDLERGQLDLDAAIKAYERGTMLKGHCESKLKEAQLRVDKITVGQDGKVGAESFESE